MEDWKPVDRWETAYEVSDLGRVRSLTRTISLTNRFGRPETRVQRGKVLAAPIGKGGYRMVTLTAPGGVKEYRYVHDLVTETFIGKRQDGHEVCHRNGVRDDCRLCNLRYGTRSSNALDRHAHGTMNQARGEQHYFRKLTEEDVLWIRENHGVMTLRDMAEALGVSHSTVDLAAKRKSWRHVV